VVADRIYDVILGEGHGSVLPVKVLAVMLLFCQEIVVVM
jgi:hypothetical protein